MSSSFKSSAGSFDFVLLYTHILTNAIAFLKKYICRLPESPWSNTIYFIRKKFHFSLPRVLTV